MSQYLPFPKKITMQPGNGGEALMAPGVMRVPFSATLAEVNASKVAVPRVPGYVMRPSGFFFSVTGTFATGTDIRLSSDDATPVDVATVPVASLTNGAKLVPETAAVVLGAGWNQDGVPNRGLQIRATGAAMTGGTSIQGWIEYQLVNQ